METNSDTLHEALHFCVEQLNQYIPGFHQYLPDPDKMYESAGSTLTAGVIGAASGLIGRVIYPNTGVSPLNYAVWFTIAYQIKKMVEMLGSRFEAFLGEEISAEFLDRISGYNLGFSDQIRAFSWKVFHHRNSVLEKMDQLFCYVFAARPYEQVTAENVYEASFFEMCRFRMWKIFKMTVLDTASIALAYRLSNGMGFTLPARTSLPLILVIESIVSKTILVPALYTYVNFCSKMAEELISGDDFMAFCRVETIKKFLPKL